MKATRYVGVLILALYATLPFVAAFLAARRTDKLDDLAFDVALSSVPLLLLTVISWRLVWPRWKLFGKLLIHPCIYLILSIYIDHWSILVAWIHQGVLGLGGHIWFSCKHGFTWYAVEDVERYIRLSKSAVGIASKPNADRCRICPRRR